VPTEVSELLPLTKILRSPVVDRSGETLGQVDDVIVRLTDSGYPPVTGLQGRIGGRRVFLPQDMIAELQPDRVLLSGETLNLARFERRPGEVLLNQDVLDHKLIDVEAGRLVHANDIALGRVDGRWRVVGVDTHPRRLLRRLLPRRFRGHLEPGAVLDWSGIEPFVGHVPTARLLLPLRRLKRLHPAQIADLVEAASHDEGEEIITAVHGDPELEADVFEELDTEHQIEFLRERSDAEAAKVLASMAADDAADLISDLDQDRRASLLSMLPAKQQAKVRALLAYNPSTAGGLMSPDFLAVEGRSSVADALERVRAAQLSVAALSTVYPLDDGGKLIGSVSLAGLVRADLQSLVADAVEVSARVRVDADFTDVALLMSDFNLTLAPVVDGDDRLVGVISVDDVLETLLPEEWRRRVEAAAQD
jgi:CBS domain-containing protein